MATKISQKQYLKKYLSGDKKKKKKNKQLKSKATVKIIDDDVHGSHDLEIDEELFLTGEDAPQIVGIIDASLETAQSKWKSIGGIKKEDNSEDDDIWGKKVATRGNLGQSPIRKKSPRPADQSPPRRALPARCNPDQSPPRKASERYRNVNDHTSPSKKRSRWNVDKSPSRIQSPPEKRSSVSPRKDSDQSPQRKSLSNRRRRDSDQSPPRRRSPTRLKKDSDHSPRRRRSPDRKRKESDQSPVRRHTTNNSHNSPPKKLGNQSRIRIKRENSSDQSPPRRRDNVNPFKTSIKQENPSPEYPNRVPGDRGSESPPPTHKPLSAKMSKTLDGKRAGLQDAQTLKIETEERRRNEDRMFKNMSKEISGRDAEVQVRQSSSYRRRPKNLDEDPEVQRKKEEHELKKKELYSRWNKGIKQIEAYKEKMSDEHYEGSKPLARYSNDVDLEEMLRQKEREDDPMLAYMRSKKKEQQLTARIPVLPKYKGSYPENRFGIPPGYRWDGVDRSNGYEKKWFDVQNSKEAVAEEAYKYSVEDL